MPLKPEHMVIPFGRYTGRTVGDIFNLDPAYLPWLRDHAILPALADAIENFCDEHCEAIAAATDQADMRREREQLLRRHR